MNYTLLVVTMKNLILIILGMFLSINIVFGAVNIINTDSKFVRSDVEINNNVGLYPNKPLYINTYGNTKESELDKPFGMRTYSNFKSKWAWDKYNGLTEPNYFGDTSHIWEYRFETPNNKFDKYQYEKSKIYSYKIARHQKYSMNFKSSIDYEKNIFH